tara:strand:+ start:66237 stop:66431 length:195 start_codon:yes stop_codon:yes gene_type:complete
VPPAHAFVELGELLLDRITAIEAVLEADADIVDDDLGFLLSDGSGRVCLLVVLFVVDWLGSFLC